MDNLLQIGHDEGFCETLLKDLATIATEKTLSTKTTLIDFNQKVNEIFFIENGIFVLKTWDEEKEVDRTVNFFLDSFQPFMTDINAYFTGSKSLNSITSLTESHIISFKKQELENLASKYPKFQDFYFNMIVMGLIAENSLRIKLLTYSSEKLYKYLLSDHPEIIQNVPSKHIASYLGISDVWLSNIKRKMIY